MWVEDRERGLGDSHLLDAGQFPVGWVSEGPKRTRSTGPFEETARDGLNQQFAHQIGWLD